MESQEILKHTLLFRMDEQDRMSQASSVATISYFPVTQESDGKVQTFGKRCHAAKRDPNCPVIIRGWLNKKDSAGLKLWKRRWFVLSNYCLFYYKDSREESVLGSIPLPSYKILFCSPRECKNRKFTFKVVHQGMRSYFFSADTQEDMLGWVRALSQSAAMEVDSSIHRRCSSYQDFTQMGCSSSESMDFPKSPSDGDGPVHRVRLGHLGREPSQLSGGRMGRRRERPPNTSPSDRTPSPPELSRRPRGPDPLPDYGAHADAPVAGGGSLTPRGHLGSRPHTPVGRVDIRPHDDLFLVPHSLYYSPPSPKMEFRSAPTTPVSERWHGHGTASQTYASFHPPLAGRRPRGKRCSAGANTDFLPPLPPLARATQQQQQQQQQQHHHHHHHHRSHVSVCVLPPATGPKLDPRDPAVRPLDADADTLLTRLCGCDKLLQSLSVELAQLQLDKDSVQCALEVSRLQLDQWQNQGLRAQEESLDHKALLQEELVTIRARMCDVSVEMERVWSQYERMESELSVLRSHLQHICSFGLPQDQSQAQRELWMMEDILSGLKVNRDHFCFLLGLQRHHMYQPTHPPPGPPGSPTERLHGGPTMEVEEEPPVRPALPLEVQENQQNRDLCHGHAYEGKPQRGGVEPAHRRGRSQSDLSAKTHRQEPDSLPLDRWRPSSDSNNQTKKMKISEEEPVERTRRHQDGVMTQQKPPLPAANGQTSQTQQEAPFPLRVTRVVTAVLPSSLVARRVSVEDPPAELRNPLPEQIPPQTQHRPPEHSNNMLSKPSRGLLLDSPGITTGGHPDQAVKKTRRQQNLGANRSSRKDQRPEPTRKDQRPEPSRSQDHRELKNGRMRHGIVVEEGLCDLLTPEGDLDLRLSPEQRDAKLRRVERIRERVLHSAVRESVTSLRGQRSALQQQDDAQTSEPARKHRLRSDHEKSQDGGFGNGERRIRGELQLSSDEDHREGPARRSQSKTRSSDKTQQKKDGGGRTAVSKTKTRRPASPYHVSAITVYQKEGGGGFVRRKSEEDEEQHEGPESSSPPSELKAKWFLSTNAWQQQQQQPMDAEPRPISADDVAVDSGEMLSTVRESLEKMKENHALFYKIACDISISDTDIAKSDGAAAADDAPPSRRSDDEELLIVESVRDESVSDVGGSPNRELQNSALEREHVHGPGSSAEKRLDQQDHKPGPGSSARVPPEQLLDQQDQGPGSSARVPPEQLLDQRDQGPGSDSPARVPPDERGVSESVTSDQEAPREANGVSEEDEQHNDNNNNSRVHGDGLIRTESFGKTRVTVLRTSL